MNQRERFLKTVSHEEPDRLMYYVQGFIGNTLNEWKVTVEDTIEDDQVMIDPEFGDRTIRNRIGDDFVSFSEGAPYAYPSVKYEDNPNSTLDCYGRIHFHGKQYAGEPYSWYVGPYFDSLEKRAQFYEAHGEPWDEKFLPPENAWKSFEHRLKYLEEKDYPWMPLNHGGSLWEHLFEGMGPKFISYLARKNPSALHQIIDDITRPMKYCMQREVEAGAMVIGMFDDMGQKERPLLSPKLFDEFLAPEYRDMIQIAHKAGAYFWLHSCGNITELLPSLVDCGLDVWQTLEPASGVNLAEVKEKYGDKMTFTGAIDYSNTLPFGTPEEIETHIKNVLRAGMPGGGYIAGPSHDVMDVPLANVILGRDLVKKYGVYPIDF